MSNVWAPSEPHSSMAGNIPMHMMGPGIMDMNMMMAGNLGRQGYSHSAPLLPTPHGSSMDMIRTQQHHIQMVQPGVRYGEEQTNINDNMDLCNEDSGDGATSKQKCRVQTNRRRRSRSQSRTGANNTTDRRRERKSKWEPMSDGHGVPGNNVQGQGMPNNIMHGKENLNTMQYGNVYNNQIMHRQPIIDNNLMIQGQMGVPGQMPMPGNIGLPDELAVQSQMGMSHIMGMQGSMPVIDRNYHMYQSIPLSNNAVLMPPNPGYVPPQRRQKPQGCKTIFVGGLPAIISVDTVKEIFIRFGNVVDVNLNNKKGFCYLRFDNSQSVESSFTISGFRFKYRDMHDDEAMSIFVDYAVNRMDKEDFEKHSTERIPSPPRVEPFTPTALEKVIDKIKSEKQFAEAAPTLVTWLERGECSKRNSNLFYSMIQASNNQVRRLLSEKMALDEELHSAKLSVKERLLTIITQFGAIAKILEAAKLQRVWDHFTKQQRKNIEMWQKMTEELENVREEYNAMNEEDDYDAKHGTKMVSEDKYEKLKRENESLTDELAGYKNEAHLIKEEAERKFEKFKAHFIAQQALQGNTINCQPLQPPPMAPSSLLSYDKTPEMRSKDANRAVLPIEARLISVITAYLLVHPRGTSADNITAYVRSFVPQTSTATVAGTLAQYPEIFEQKSTGYTAKDDVWLYKMFADA